MSSQESIYFLIRLCAIFVVILPMSISTLAIYIRNKLNQEEEVLYRKWRIASWFITTPAFIFAFVIFILASRCIAILFFTDMVFAPEALSVYGIKKGTLIVFVIFWAVLFVASIIASVFGWRYGDDHSDFEFSSWFLRTNSSVEILDEEQKIKISWAMTYALLPKAVVLYVIAILFSIAPAYFSELALNTAKEAVPPQLEEVSTNLKRNCFSDCDEQGEYYIRWRKLDNEFFESYPEYDRKYLVEVWDIDYTFNDQGQLVKVVARDDVEKELKKQIGRVAEIDQFGFFVYHLTHLPLGRVEFRVEPPKWQGYKRAFIDIKAPKEQYVEAEPEPIVKEEPIIVSEEEDVVFTVVEKMPEFPGGQQALFKYLSENVTYPVIAKENGIQGRVICQFVVNRDGSIIDVEVVRCISLPILKEC